MLKHFFFTPVCLVALVLLLSGCDLSVHAKNTQQASPAASVAQNTVVPAVSPVVQSTAANPVAPVASASAGAVTTDPPIVQAPTISSIPERPAPVSVAFPTFAPDPGARVLYNRAGAQAGSNESRVFTNSFPATPGFLVHIICRGSGLIKVEVSSGIINELSCPQSDNVNEYYTSAPSSRYAIRVTAMGAIVWRVVVEGIN